MSATRRVTVAMAASPRTSHLPPEQWEHAEEDRPLPLFGGQTNSQPSTVADMLQLLDVREGARVLDIGAGSGWTTAILAYLTGPSGSVLGLEINPALADWGAANLETARRPWARIEPARPGVLGAPEHGPFDHILVSAMATHLPGELLDQLAPGGVLVIPVDGRMVRITRRPDRAGRPDYRAEQFGHYRFVPLITE